MAVRSCFFYDCGQYLHIMHEIAKLLAILMIKSFVNFIQWTKRVYLQKVENQSAGVNPSWTTMWPVQEFRDADYISLNIVIQ